MDISKLLAAAAFAAEQHIGQQRKGDTDAPYVNHVIEVANLLSGVGGSTDIEVLIAALLHDTVEDGETGEKQIRQRFGSRVASIVMELTDDPRLSEPDRRKAQVEHAPKLSPAAKLIKLGDKISNIRDVLENPPKEWSKQELQDYIHWGKAVVNGLGNVNPALERLFDRLVSEY